MLHIKSGSESTAPICIFAYTSLDKKKPSEIPRKSLTIARPEVDLTGGIVYSRGWPEKSSCRGSECYLVSCGAEETPNQRSSATESRELRSQFSSGSPSLNPDLQRPKISE
ncbi:hypothetical protein ElyMa_005880200 [Elysia marginata]|uniref:Uncharacterized protein n=1 Tax=Elysia marginata TaxID=1093978 RepID=A0AAV4G320_9GAST|nr:hypothetical protein ElyMa_005880200 [Elysia marginata]